MSSYDRRSDNFEVLQQRQRAQQRKDQSFSMLGTAGLYSRRGKPLPNRREFEQQRRIETLQRQQMVQQMQLQEEFEKEKQKLNLQQNKEETRRMNGIVVLQNHDDKIKMLETKIDSVISNMQNADSIFNNVNNKSQKEFSSFEKKLELLENAIRKKSPQENVDFENTIISRIENANKKVAQKLEQFEVKIQTASSTNTVEGSTVNEDNIKEIINNKDKIINKRLQDTNTKLIERIEQLNKKIENIPVVTSDSSASHTNSTKNIEKIIKTSETGIMKIIQNMEKSINKRIDAEFTKKMEYFDSQLKGIEHKAGQVAAGGGGKGGGNALSMINRIRDELGDRMSAMERQGGGS